MTIIHWRTLLLAGMKEVGWLIRFWVQIHIIWTLFEIKFWNLWDKKWVDVQYLGFPITCLISGHPLLSSQSLGVHNLKTKIIAFSSITWQTDGETMETVTYFIFLGSKITADGDWSHEIKTHLLLGRKIMTNLDSIKAETLLCQQRSV